MKRKELIRKIEKAGCVFLRHGSRHDLYMNPVNGKKKPIPRHTEIDNPLVRHIKKFLQIDTL